MRQPRCSGIGGNANIAARSASIQGLAERTPPAADRRVRALTTTQDGRTRRHRLRLRLRNDNPLLDKLSWDENDLLLSLLRRLLDDR